MESTVIIPHKDTLFFLTKLQKEVITRHNKTHNKNEWIMSCYPLWCIDFDSPLLSNDLPCKFFVINKPLLEKGFYFFPVKIFFSERTINGKITFAKNISDVCCPENQEIFLTEEEDKNFPLMQKSFRLCDVVFENNGWKVLKEEWVKCSSS